jgi:hypothetical protein
MVILKLDRSDYDRINLLLGHVAAAGACYDPRSAAYDSQASKDAFAIGSWERALALMPPDDAKRLCAETDRQAQES